MMNLVTPRLMSLDSAQLGSWARDRASENIKRRSAALQFQQALVDRGVVIFLSFHHLEELLCTESDADAAACIDLIASLPIVAWVAHANGTPGLGAIVDTKAHEVRSALSAPDAPADEIRTLTKSRLIRTGSGIEALDPYIRIWRQLRPHLRARAQEAQRIVAVTRADAVNIDRKKIADLRRGRVRRPDEAAGHLAHLQLSLQREVTTRGDIRIAAPADVARDFVESVSATILPLMAEPDRLHENLLAMMHIDPDELPPNATMADINELYLFRQQVMVSGEAAGESWDIEIARRLTIDRIPSSLIESALRRYRQDQPERKGSDLNDGYLACLAPYAELTFVDKRTMENIRRALPKVAGLGDLMQSVRKSCTYLRTLTHLPSERLYPPRVNRRQPPAPLPSPRGSAPSATARKMG
jgi:hypothetical protein